MEIVLTPANSREATQMIESLNADLLRRYPDAPIFGIDAETFEADGGIFAIAYDGDAPVACGAFRPYLDMAEFKRLYVVPAMRRRGVAKAVLRFLEAEARRRGYARAVLETGSGQPEAISLYENLGWSEIPPFGEYADDDAKAQACHRGGFRHVCFMKTL